jgi:hypothetical protein
MLHNLCSFLFKMPFISYFYLILFLYYSHFKYRVCKNLKKSSGAKGLINSCVGQLFGLHSYSILSYTTGWKALNYLWDGGLLLAFCDRQSVPERPQRTASPPKMGPTSLLESSVTEYHSALHKIPEELILQGFVVLFVCIVCLSICVGS